MLATDEERPAAEREGQRDSTVQFEQMILDNFRKAGVQNTAWSSLYSTVSRPFAPPETGRIAVRVINHYGDEVLRVFDLELKA